MSRWPCLLYHEVLAENAPREGSNYFAVRAPQFAEQLDMLRVLGAQGGTLESVIADTGPGRVAITFDDGQLTHATVALPLLLSRSMAATFFVITGRVGSTGYCTWDDLREMGRAGMSLQSHTHTHPFLSQLDRDAVLVELRRSREELDDQLGQRTTTLALPGGDFPRGWRATDFRDAGYRWVATSRWGPNDVAHDTFFVRRYTVRRETRLEAFVRMAEGSAPAYSAEGLRLTALNGLRSLLGASRYARWRRRFLVSLGR